MQLIILASVAAVTTVLGPSSHVLLWRRLDQLDSHSHQLVLLAILAVLVGPFALWLRGYTFLDALRLSLTADSCYAASLILSICTYRAFLHPLRQFPGPFWARISVFWKVQHFKANYEAFRVFDNLHKKYGDVVRIAPRQLSLNHPSAYQAIYGSGSECRRMVTLERLRKNLQSLSDPEEHAVRRKVWDHGMSAKACQSYLPKMNETTNRLCEAFEAFDGKAVTVNNWCHFYTFDIMGDIGFGQSYKQIETARAHPAIAKAQSFCKVAVIAFQLPWAVNFAQQMPGMDDPLSGLTKWVRQLLVERAQSGEAKKGKDDFRDLMSYLEESRQIVDTRWPMSDKDVEEDVVTLQIAASDTSYSVIANLCHYLANYPELQGKIRKEILETFTDNDIKSAPVWSKLSSTQSCPYLDATVREILRLHPPVLLGMLRETPEYPIEIAGHTIPPRTIVSCPVYTIQHDERCFQKADLFIPERWLDSSNPSSQADLLVDQRGFVPFSVGPMVCAGKYFAYMEIKVFAAKLLRQFEIVFPGSGAHDKDEKQEPARRRRDQMLMNCMKDYFTQEVGQNIDVCFRPLHR